MIIRVKKNAFIWLYKLLFIMHPFRTLLLIIFITFYLPVQAQLKFELPLVKDTTPFKQGIAHTAHLLTSGTKNQPKEVRILVYGQSISAQEWWLEVKEHLIKQYPLARINMVNKAIGGFSAERLKLTAANDVRSFYPDLILFHDYGNEADYEAIIQTIRKHTTAEIAIQTDHMAQQNQEWHDRHSKEWLPALCRKYNLGFIDVRRFWKAYLTENNLQVNDLLTDGVHLNRQGNYLMAAIVKDYFKSLPTTTYVKPSVRILKAGKDFKVVNNRLSVAVTGNRIDLVWNAKHPVPANPVNVRIANKTPTSLSNCYYYTRPALDTTGFFLRRIGQLIAMQLREGVTEETWMLTITAIDTTRQQLQFALQGSVTGDDGKGSSDTVFMSRTGKIRIQPEWWFRRKNPNDFAQFHWLQPGDVLRWDVKPMCYDVILPNPGASMTIAQGLENGLHYLQLSGKGLHGLKEIKVYQPPLK